MEHRNLVFAIGVATLIFLVGLVLDRVVVQFAAEPASGSSAYAGRIDSVSVAEPGTPPRCGDTWITVNGGQTFHLDRADLPALYAAQRYGMEVILWMEPRFGCPPKVVRYQQWVKPDLPGPQYARSKDESFNRAETLIRDGSALARVHVSH